MAASSNFHLRLIYLDTRVTSCYSFDTLYLSTVLKDGGAGTMPSRTYVSREKERPTCVALLSTAYRWMWEMMTRTHMGQGAQAQLM